jgi:hypothetical protein
MIEYLKKIFKIADIFLIIITLIILVSLLFLVIFNKNYTILVLYFGLLITIFLSKQLGKILKLINNKKEYREYYKQILNTSLSNFTKIPKDYVWISPNGFMLAMAFIYFYLYLSFSFSYKLNNETNRIPDILVLFIGIMIIYCLINIVSLLLNVWKKNEIKNINMLDFILRAGIYNLSFSFIIGLIFSFLYFTIIKTFFKKQLFFQSRKKCSKDNVCFYDPIKTNWIYNFN